MDKIWIYTCDTCDEVVGCEDSVNCPYAFYSEDESEEDD